MKEIGIRIGLIIVIAIFIASGWYFLAPFFNSNLRDMPARFNFPAKEEVGMIMPPQTIAEVVAARLAGNPLGADQATITGTAIMSAVNEDQAADAAAADPVADPESAATPTITPTAILPLVIGQGQFVDGDIFHKGSGTATILQAADGSYVLRLTEFTSSVGPDLRVLLSPTAAPASHARLGEYFEIGKLKGNIGDQEYNLPDDFDPTAYKSVVIYCQPFRVIFATATLK